MLALIVLLPLIAAIIAIAVLREGMTGRYIAIGASAVALVLSLLVSQGLTTIPWFNLAGNQFNITILVTPLNLMLLILVQFMATVILVYSAGFMEAVSEQRRFYIEMLAFQMSMTLFAISGNFVTLFIAWEFLSILSYMLIGFWFDRGKANRAAREAITIVLIGDLAILAAIAIFWNVFGTLEFTTIIASLPNVMTPELSLGVIFLVIAVFTKSAQFPFQEWLTAAMEGPTPVSAFLHSSTMVKAGVFTVMILSPLFIKTGAMPVILIVGILTAVIATLNAMREKHIKKVIAYSTIQELSLMLVAIAGGAIIAAAYFFLVQSFYKALLFFSAGAVMKGTNEEDLDKTTGLKENKLIYTSTLYGVLSLAGFIPFAGFFAATGISSSFTGNIAIYAIISLIGMATSFYIFRLFFLTSRDPKDSNTAFNYLSIPNTMVYSMVVLAAVSLGGAIAFHYLPYYITTGFMAKLYATNASAITFNLTDGLTVTILAVIGAVIGYLAYASKYSARFAKVKTKSLDTLVYNGPFVNKAYLLISNFFYELSEGIAVFDLYLSDAFDALGTLTMKLSDFVRKASVGQISPYAFVFAFGIIALFIYVYLMI